MISIKDLSKQFPGQDKPAIDNVSFDIQPGETLVLLGTSGSGKTTFLKMLNRLIEPTSGNINFNNEDILTLNPIAWRRRCGTVFQKPNLFPHMTVEKNIGITLKLIGTSKKIIKAKAHDLLKLVNLDPDLAGRYPEQLSGGQQQRVGVARALATDPELLLMDEPFGALDNITRQALQQEVLSLKKQLHKTIVFVTHDIGEAFLLADRIAILNEGELQQLGTPNEIQQQPANVFVKELIGKAHAT